MTSPDDAVGIHSGQAALASVTSLDLATLYSGLDSLWNAATAECAAAVGQPVITAAIQAYGAEHIATVNTLMTHAGALPGVLDASVQSGADVDQMNSADFGAVVGALAIGASPRPGE